MTTTPLLLFWVRGLRRFDTAPEQTTGDSLTSGNTRSLGVILLFRDQKRGLGLKLCGFVSVLDFELVSRLCYLRKYVSYELILV